MAVEEVKKLSKPVFGDHDRAGGQHFRNSDPLSANIICEAMKVGKDGLYGRGSQNEDHRAADRGWDAIESRVPSPYFVSDANAWSAFSRILTSSFHDRKISNMKDLLPFSADWRAGKPLLVIVKSGRRSAGHAGGQTTCAARSMPAP